MNLKVGFQNGRKLMTHHKDIFFSYSRKDKEIIDRVADIFTGTGISFWRDTDAIAIGDYWREEIVRAINTVKKFVLVVTLNSIGSKEVLRELYLADKREPSVVLPVYYDDVFDPPAEMGMMLVGINHFVIENNFGNVHKLASELKREISGVSTSNEILAIYFFKEGFEKLRVSQFLTDLSIILELAGKKLAIDSVSPSSSPIKYFNLVMDSESAAKIKTLALNSDTRLVDLGIEKIKSLSDNDFIVVSSPPITKGLPSSIYHLPQKYVEEKYAEEKEIFPTVADTALTTANFEQLSFRELETGWAGLGFGGLSDLNSVKIMSLNGLIHQEVYQFAKEKNLRFREAKKLFSSPKNIDSLVEKARLKMKIKPKDSRSYIEYFLSQQ